MRFKTAGAAGKAAWQSAFRVVERDAALRGTTGFESAWSVASAIPGWFGEAEASAFWAVIEHASPKTVVEIGSYQGRSTTLLGLALRHQGISDARLVAIDPHTGDRQHLDHLGLSSAPSLDMFKLHTAGAGLSGLIDLRVATSDDVASEWTDSIDLLFIDGWHSYDAVVSDGRNFASNLSDAGFVCFDDYGNYEEVRRAVDDVIEEFRLTFYGLVGSQAWAGRLGVPPDGLHAAIRVNNFRRRIAQMVPRSRPV